MAPEEALSIATITFKGVKEIASFLAIVGTGGLLLFSWVRAGSAHFLRERVWALFGGSKEFHDPYLNEQWMKVRDLEAARYKTGIHFQCRKKAAETFAWLDAHDVPLDDLLKGARYFDPSEILVRDPQLKAKCIASWLSTGVLLLIMTVFIAFSLSSYALLTVKKTDTAVWTDGETAKSWDFRSWKADAKSCKDGNAPIQNEHDKKVICELITTDTKAFIEKSLSSQKYVGALSAVFLMLIVVFILRSLNQARAAQRVYEKTTYSQPIQLDLNLS
ncbi:DUF6216 family protein [Pseudomonas borbori]